GVGSARAARLRGAAYVPLRRRHVESRWRDGRRHGDRDVAGRSAGVRCNDGGARRRLREGERQAGGLPGAGGGGGVSARGREARDVEDHVVRARRVVRVAFALVALAGCRRPEMPVAPAPVAWSIDRLHATGAPPLDKAIEAALAPYADVAPLRFLDIS